MKAKNEPSVTFRLFEKYPDKAKDERPEVSARVAKDYEVYEAKRARQNLEPARSVIDLHMEKLSDDWQHMSNFEILNMQLGEFEKWYHLAVAHHLQSMVVIHGVGSGKLRDEIHDLLKQKTCSISLTNTIRVLAMVLQKSSSSIKPASPYCSRRIIVTITINLYLQPPPT